MKNSLLSLFFALGTLLSGAEYFVTPADSLQKAVNKLQPGDILTLKEGVYRQGTVTTSIKGTAAKPIIIRGIDREKTIITGWKSLDDAQWQSVPGQRFVYRTPVKEAVHNVTDLNTERFLLTAPSLADMEKFRGTFLCDKGFLYVHSFDGRKPGKGFRATVHSGYLFLLQKAAYVKFENLTFCGSAYKDPRYSSWSIAIRCTGTSDVTVEKCSFYYNSGGVAFTVRSRNSVAKNNFFHRNDAAGYAEAAQLFFGGQSKNNLAENNLVVNTGVHGVRFYSGAIDNTARNNIIVNARIGLYYKATAGKRLAQGNVVIDCPNTNYSDLQGGRPIRDISNTFGYPSQVYDPNITNLIMKRKTDPRFCAPEYYDYRLQKNSPFLGKGAFPKAEAVFYLSPAGKDTNDGGSVRKPFRTWARALKALKPGSTLYIEQGKYDSFKGKVKDVVIRGRGNVSVREIDLTGSEKVTVEGIFAEKLNLQHTRDAVAKNVAAKSIAAGNNSAFYNCEYSSLTGRARVYNSLCKGTPAGYVSESPLLPGIKKVAAVDPGKSEKPSFNYHEAGVTVSWVTPGVSADHYRMKDSWWSPQVCTSYLEYGETPALGKKAFSSGNLFHRVTLKGMVPGKKYYCRTVIPAQPLERKNLEPWKLAAFTGVRPSGNVDVKSETVTFTVPRSSKHKAVEYFVSPTGDDNGSGSAKAPFRTIGKAASKAFAGDTVTLLPGIYYDTIMPVHSGTAEKPVLFRAAEAGTVILDGSNFMRPGGIVCSDLEHIKFQGFIFRNFANKLYANRAGAGFGMAQLWRSNNIEIKDCVFSAWGTYQHPVMLLGSRDIKVVNSVFARGVTAVDGSRNGNVEIRNCTFYVSEIHNIGLSHQIPGSTVTVRNNLFVALTGVKALNRVERTGISGTDFKVDFDNNCWYFSPKDKYRYCGGEGGKISITGKAGVARLYKMTGWGKNDIEISSIRFKGHTFYDPFEKGFTQITSKNIQSGKIVPSLDFFEAECSNKYGVKAVK